MPGTFSSPQQKRLGALLIALLLIVGPACFCTNIPIPGINNADNPSPVPTEMLDSDSGSLSGDGSADDSSAAIDESAADDEASESYQALDQDNQININQRSIPS